MTEKIYATEKTLGKVPHRELVGACSIDVIPIFEEDGGEFLGLGVTGSTDKLKDLSEDADAYTAVQAVVSCAGVFATALNAALAHGDEEAQAVLLKTMDYCREYLEEAGSVDRRAEKTY